MKCTHIIKFRKQCLSCNGLRMYRVEKIYVGNVRYYNGPLTSQVAANFSTSRLTVSVYREVVVLR